MEHLTSCLSVEKSTERDYEVPYWWLYCHLLGTYNITLVCLCLGHLLDNKEIATAMYITNSKLFGFGTCVMMISQQYDRELYIFMDTMSKDVMY